MNAGSADFLYLALFFCELFFVKKFSGNTFLVLHVDSLSDKIQRLCWRV